MTASYFPARSSAAKAVADVFYIGLQPLHIFVEDSYQENLYSIIIEKAFGAVIPGFKIFPQSGKAGVINHALANPPGADSQKRLYLVDKDFDDLLGLMVVREDIFYLDQYCIENCLIQRESVMNFVVDEKPKLSRGKISTKIAFSKKLRGWMGGLDSLHRLFVLIQRHGLGIKNCKHPPEFFTDVTRPCEFDSTKLLAYEKVVADALINQGVISGIDEMADLKAGAILANLPRDCYISGKFVLKLLLIHLRTEKLCGNVVLESFVIRLARFSSFGRLAMLRERVRNFLS